MDRRGSTWMLLAMVLSLVAGCGPRSGEGTTGYAGTWVRRDGASLSTIEIAPRGGTYVFRWALTSEDDRRSVRCADWNGPCEELRDGERIAVHTFRSWIDESTGRLRIEGHGKSLVEGGEDLHFVDELVVVDEGEKLLARTIELSGRPVREGERSERSYGRVSAPSATGG